MGYYEAVPRSFKENLEYRIRLARKCAEDEAIRTAALKACKEDVLYWMSAFVWVYEPRPRFLDGKRLPTSIPFIPWEHQIPVILQLRESLGVRDIGLEKSRGEGMSWIAVLMAMHDWIFTPMSKVGLVSRNEKAADNPNDPDSLFWKIDWELTKLPKWMVGIKGQDWKRSLDDHSLVNLKNGASVTAYSATAHVGRGGRYTWFLMDELGSFPRGPDHRAVKSTQHATDSRLYVSTPEGADGAYFEIMHTPSSMLKLRMHWSQNPTKNRGLYKFVKGQCVVQDPIGNPLPPNYIEENKDLFSRLRTKGYNLEKGWRSPWYDQECDRPGATPQAIAQELDLDYAGSKHLIFGADFAAAAEETLRAPRHKGTIHVHPEELTVDFEATWDGSVELWCNLDHANRPPRSSYVVSCDVSTGLGGSYTSNSVLQVIDANTREQVMEFATNVMQPHDFADLAIGVAKWFWDAYLAWEINGPGTAFTGRIKDRGYGNVYTRTVLWKSTANRKTKEVGWHTSDKTLNLLLADIIAGVKEKRFTIRSKHLIAETRQYQMEDGKVVNALQKRTSDDSSKGASHGDRVIALGVGIQALKDRPSESLWNDSERDPPEGSMEKRYLDWLKQNSPSADGWVERTNGGSMTGGSFSTAAGRDWGDSSWD